VETPTSWRNLAEMDLVFARSRRRAALRRSEPTRRSALDWRTVRAVVIAILLLGFVAEGTQLVETAPAKSAAPKRAEAAGQACGIPTGFSGAFRAAAHETGLSLSLLAAVAWEESRMDPAALSGAGARGVLQLMPGTAKALAISPANPRANIIAGARYLGQLLTRFHGNLELALVAYNAGPTAVEKLGRAPSLATLRYAKNIETRAASLSAC
jgi:soluble lytic murein transglycosylase-like protein